MSTFFDSGRLLDATHCATHGIPPGRFAELSRRVDRAAFADGLTVIRNDATVPYPMLPSLVQLDAELERGLAWAVPRVHRALRKIVSAHRVDSALRSYLDVPGALLPWVDDSPESEYRIDFCRFDFVGGGSSPKIVEFNANCPGGTIFTGAYGRLWREEPAVSALLAAWQVGDAQFDRRHWFPEFLLSTLGRRVEDRGGAGPVALFRKPGGNVLELDKMAALLDELGWRALVADPAAVKWPDEARLGYLKYGVQAVLGDIGGWAVFLDRIAEGKLRIVNPLPGRWIGDNKLCLAVMSDPRFARLFDEEERAAIRMLVPYSRRVGDGVEPNELQGARDQWVLKGPYDTRGNSVYVGAEQDAATWRRLVDQAAREHWLAQLVVQPDTRVWDGERLYQDLSVVLLRGRFAGYTSRLSRNFRVNVAQGGGRQVVFGHQSAGWPADAL